MRLAMADHKNAPAQELLLAEIKVVNVGLESFAKDLKSCNVPVVQVDWVPPAGGDPKMAALLAKLGV
jgi:FdrA protein